MSRRVDWGLAARWVWRSRSPLAALTRVGLLPAAGLFRAGMAARNAAYDFGLMPVSRLPRPSIGVGNLAVGGVGKTPIASFLAAEMVRRGRVPGILLRGYGDDETRELARAVPEAVVVAGPDRRACARRAVEAGAGVLVLDDCLQRRDILPDLMLAVLSAESDDRRWPLPAGPWREGLGALARADAVVVSHKTSREADAAALARRLGVRSRSGNGMSIELSIGGFRPLEGGGSQGRGAVGGREVLAVCGIAEPELFRAQLERLGATVRLMAFGDHRAYDASDVAAILRGAGGALVVTTAKDAVKLGPLWPRGGPACLVATLAVRISSGAEALAALLDGVAGAAPATLNPGALPPSRGA